MGMNAVVMDGAYIAPRCIVAATAFVKAGFQCPEQSLVVGSPAQAKRTLSDQEIAWKQRGTAEYQLLAKRCMAALVECPPLTEVKRCDRAWVTRACGQKRSRGMNQALPRNGQAGRRAGIVGVPSASSSPMSSLAPLIR